MARTTPAQNPRGEQSSTLSFGFCAIFAVKIAIQCGSDMARQVSTWAGGLFLSSKGVAPNRPCPYIPATFPIIADGRCFARKGGRSAKEICLLHKD
jgi:hypothetical protein